MRNNRARVLATMVAACCAVLMTSDAVADTDNYWNVVAAGCVPSETAIQGNRYAISAGVVVFTSGSNAQITMHCPVSENTGETNPNYLWLSWYSSVSSDFFNNISAQLWRMNRDTGTLTSVLAYNTVGQTSGYHNAGAAFTHTLDFNSYFYYVKMDMKRNLSTNVFHFLGVGLGRN